MKKIILSLLFASTVFCQTPKADFLKKSYNFGDVKEGEYVTYMFPLVNQGDAVLIIDKIRASCGCTAAVPEKNKIEPGDSTKIKVEFNTYRRQGSQRKHVYVFTNDPNLEQQRLTFTANVVPKTEEEKLEEEIPILKLDENYYNLGDIPRDTVLTIAVKLNNIGKEKLKIRSVRSSCTCLTAQSSGMLIDPGSSEILKVELNTKNRSGKMSRTVTIISDDPYKSYQAIVFLMNIVQP